jgi:hypothetical protein
LGQSQTCGNTGPGLGQSHTCGNTGPGLGQSQTCGNTGPGLGQSQTCEWAKSNQIDNFSANANFKINICTKTFMNFRGFTMRI